MGSTSLFCYCLTTFQIDNFNSLPLVRILFKGSLEITRNFEIELKIELEILKFFISPFHYAVESVKIEPLTGIHYPHEYDPG